MTFKKDDIGFDGQHFTFKDGVYQNLKKIFAEKEFEDEVKKAERWLLFNPPKKDYRRYLCNWLNNSKTKSAITLEKEKYYYKQRSGVESAPKAVDFGKYNPNA